MRTPLRWLRDLRRRGVPADTVADSPLAPDRPVVVPLDFPGPYSTGARLLATGGDIELLGDPRDHTVS